MEGDASPNADHLNNENTLIDDIQPESGVANLVNNLDSLNLHDTTPDTGELQCTGIVLDDVANNLEERLSKLETELNFMHDENDRLKVENKRQLDETRKSLESKLLKMEEKLAQTLHEYGKKCEAFNELEERYNAKCITIQNMEATQSGLENLVADKDDVIKSQEIIIQSMQDENEASEKLRAANEKIEEKDLLLGRVQKELTQLQHVETEIHSIKQQNGTLQRKLDDQEIICKELESTISTRDRQLVAKDEVVASLKTLASKAPPITNNTVTSNSICNHCEKIQQQQKITSGMQECLLKLEGIALHGVILDSFLTWADMIRKTRARDVWKGIALKNFTGEEVTAAKDLLWEVCGEEVLGKTTRRQGGSKQKSEIEDICSAFDKLSEKQMLPIFIATSKMIQSTPSLHDDNGLTNYYSIEKKIQEIDESLDEFKKKQAELSMKNHDRIISKVELGQKKIDEVIKRLDMTPRQSPPNTERTLQNERDDNPSPLSGNTNSTAAQALTRENLAADVSMVVKGIALHVSENQLHNFISDQGIKTSNWKALTTYENARSLTFKFTVKATDHEKLKDLTIWPTGVTVETYKERKQTPTRSNGGTSKKRSTRFKEDRASRINDQEIWLRAPTAKQ